MSQISVSSTWSWNSHHQIFYKWENIPRVLIAISLFDFLSITQEYWYHFKNCSQVWIYAGLLHAVPASVSPHVWQPCYVFMILYCSFVCVCFSAIHHFSLLQSFYQPFHSFPWVLRKGFNKHPIKDYVFQRTLCTLSSCGLLY